MNILVLRNWRAISLETLKRRQTECHKLYRGAAETYLKLGNLKKRGESIFSSALGLLLTNDNNNKKNTSVCVKQALRELEESV